MNENTVQQLLLLGKQKNFNLHLPVMPALHAQAGMTETGPRQKVIKKTGSIEPEYHHPRLYKFFATLKLGLFAKRN